MNCTHCQEHACRTLGDCSARRFDRDGALKDYHDPANQQVVQAAAHLVDHGRGGTLNRLEEVIEYSLDRGYSHIGIAYCWSMEKEVTRIAELIRKRGLRVSAVSCTTGGLSQEQMNDQSDIAKVGCNPLGQAKQLNAEKVDLVVAVGLCLGHDMLLQKELQAPCTTLVVKDRTSGHNPLEAIRKMAD
ncbi:MAG TPA: DUF1847 domain-containing protein [Fibrobacteraceae bacterium]|nr:DUF1847 domain-containing protein [Fibrobacteraceae bacterium]